MLTFIEAISLAGDRAKQNDDACGFTGNRAWVIDGATDMHDAPLTGVASDASWIAHFANAYQAERANQLVHEGKIKPVLDQVFPFAQTAHAHALMAANKHKGKMGIAVQAAAETVQAA